MNEKINDWREVQAKSITYFSDSEPAIINKSLIKKLKSISVKNNNSNARFCLHQNPESSLHSMIILEYKDKKCRKPHKHDEKEEILHILEGQMIALMLNDRGKILKKTLLTPEENFLYSNPKGKYHIWLPLTDYVIYVETKRGPFQQKDNLNPKFNYIDILKKNIDFNLDCYNKGCSKHCSLSKITAEI